MPDSLPPTADGLLFQALIYHLYHYYTAVCQPPISNSEKRGELAVVVSWYGCVLFTPVSFGKELNDGGNDG